MISAIVNTCNEERYLERCLSHLTWADEIVIVDMHSTDSSVEIARKFTDKIFFHERAISVLYARDFSLGKARGDWLVIVDPDEVFPQALAGKISELINSHPDFSAIAIPSRTKCFGKILKYVYPLEHKLRCFKKGCVSFPARVHAKPVVKGPIHYLPADEELCLINQESDTVAEALAKINRYTTDEAFHMFHDDKVRFKRSALFLKPLAEFKNRYFLRQGYRDGIEGFIYSFIMATYYFLIYAKIWEHQRNSQAKE